MTTGAARAPPPSLAARPLLPPLCAADKPDGVTFMRKSLPRTSAYLATVALSLAACTGDDSTTGADTGTSTLDTVGTSTSASTGTTSAGTTSAGTTTMGGSGSASESESGSTTDTTTSTTDVTATDPTATTTTTGPTTTDPTGPDCTCTPGEPSGQCAGAQLEICSNDCTSFIPQPCPMGQSCSGGACVDQICSPGATQCADNDTVETCADDGLSWQAKDCGGGQICKDGACIDQLCTPGSKTCSDAKNTQTCADDGLSWLAPQACGAKQGCAGAGECQSLCEIVKGNPSSIGCSFYANRMDNFYSNENDSIVVGNVSTTESAVVQLYLAPNGSNTEAAQGAPVTIPPKGTHTFTLSNTAIDKVSVLRKGGAYRVQSDLPIIAYQHSPIGMIYTNDASMLLPDYALKQNYVVSSWRDVHSAYPSYFNVIATEPNTTVTWVPPVATSAGTGVPAVAANATGQVLMNRFDTLQVRVAAGQDVSGTLIEADKPIWVVGATECTNVPSLSCLYCDHVEEQMFPLDYWGKEYVGAPSPKRGNEKHHWRVYAGDDNITITTTPAQPGTPIVLAKKGQYKDIQVNNGTAFVFNSDKAFLPVQYLESQTCGANDGDPAMYQMVPTEQFLSSYAFATGTGYPKNWVQIIRKVGGADVLLDGVVVTGYYTVGNFQVADRPVSQGSHFAESADPFGIVSLGYSNATSYAYPGGLQFKVINPQ